MPLTFAYPFRLLRVMDGDTLEGDADLGFYVSRKVTVRLNGVNAPEVTGTAEKAVGLLVKQCVERWFSRQAQMVATRLWLVSREVDKYGRVLGEIEIRPTGLAGQTLALTPWILGNQLSKPYDGGTKLVYTPNELAAIAALAKAYLA